MSVTVLRVSDRELRRLEVLRDVDRGGLQVHATAQLLARSEHQVRRLLKAFRAEGVAGLISKKRGRPSNRRTTAAVRAAALWIVRRNYADFGPTLAAEKLAFGPIRSEIDRTSLPDYNLDNEKYQFAAG